MRRNMRSKCANLDTKCLYHRWHYTCREFDVIAVDHFAGAMSALYITSFRYWVVKSCLDVRFKFVSFIRNVEWFAEMDVVQLHGTTLRGVIVFGRGDRWLLRWVQHQYLIAKLFCFCIIIFHITYAICFDWIEYRCVTKNVVRWSTANAILLLPTASDFSSVANYYRFGVTAGS